MARIAQSAIHHVFRQAAQQHGAKPALIYLGETFSYARLERLVENLAASLHALGVEPGERALIYLPNLPQWVIAWLALQRLGAVAVPITPYYALADLEYILRDCGARTIFCLDTNFGYVTRVLPRTDLQRVVVTTMVELLPWWKRALGKALNRVPEGAFRLGGQVYALGRLLRAPAAPSPEPPADPRRLAQILYTGGTTGHPKGVPIKAAMLLTSAEGQRAAREKLLPRGADRILQGGALYHILGQALGLAGLFFGETLILLARMNLDALLDHIQRYAATTFFAVPTLYRMILEHDRFEQYDLSSLVYCFSGGDVLPQDIARRWQEQVGVPIYQGYGATETCGAISLTPAAEPFPPGTAGKVVSFQQVQVVDPETLQPVKPGQPGELLVASPHMVEAYWEKPAETARCFVELYGGRWYRTGDIVRIDEDGWLFFLDRAADIIKHKGYRVAASKIEAALQDHPAVTAACVIGLPDPAVGERIKAFVVLREDVKGVTAYDLLVHCRARLAPHEVPHYIEMRDMLPKSKVGKLLRRELRDDERRKSEAEKVVF